MSVHSPELGLCVGAGWGDTEKKLALWPHTVVKQPVKCAGVTEILSCTENPEQ